MSPPEPPPPGLDDNGEILVVRLMRERDEAGEAMRRLAAAWLRERDEAREAVRRLAAACRADVDRCRYCETGEACPYHRATVVALWGVDP